MRRLLPVIGVVYFMAYIDRSNIALAKSELSADIGLSAAAFGLGAGLFFLTYALLEVPSNLIMYRVGPRVWITRIAVTWGLVTALTIFVRDEWSFYFLRLLLGAAEAGLFPTLMYMVTTWFAHKDRAKAVGWILFAPCFAMIIGGPIGGGLMELDGRLGLHGWQWLFLIEGIVTVVIGATVWFTLPDRPKDAKWLTADEAEALGRLAVGDEPHHSGGIRDNLRAAFGRPFIAVIACVYFLNQVVTAGLLFYTPAIVEELDVSGPFLIGLVAGLGGIGALAGVLLLPRLLSTLENQVMAVAIPLTGTLITAVVFVIVAQPHARIGLIALSMFFIVGAQPIFWSIAMARMSGIVAAAGLAFINTIGLTGGFVGPYLFGLSEGATGNASAGLSVVISAAILGLFLVPALVWALRRKDAAVRGPLVPAEQ